MNKEVKELLTVPFHKNIRQVAPYIMKFDGTLPYLRCYLLDMAKLTGSTMKYIKDTKDGQELWKISDPLCKILEDTGVNA